MRYAPECHTRRGERQWLSRSENQQSPGRLAEVDSDQWMIRRRYCHPNVSERAYAQICGRYNTRREPPADHSSIRGLGGHPSMPAF
eukprot:scaffold11964_cov38-Tisochrysis_lutea.AAC.1